VHYAGWLADGTPIFDSSKEKQDPFEFTLGKKEVMPGWEEGLSGMKVGGTRKLIIPPQLAYGKEGAGDTIPPNETLPSKWSCSRFLKSSRAGEPFRRQDAKGARRAARDPIAARSL